MHYFTILLLAIVQGLAELLPVSSSAHVIMAEKFMGIDPTTPSMTLLLVMLHTGTMLAVIVYFWRSWKTTYFSSWQSFWHQSWLAALATGATGGIGLLLLKLIPRVLGEPKNFEIEQIFGNTHLIAASLATAGVLIFLSGWYCREQEGTSTLTPLRALIIGAVQGLCLPFRGFSRSGATISSALIMDMARRPAEEFSFVLAVILTPPVIAREVLRISHHQPTPHLSTWLMPSLFGMVMSFVAGLVALRWLSQWLEHGRWHYFGVYCLVAAALIGLGH